MIREIHWHQVVVSIVVYFVLMFATDVWAIFFSKGVQDDDKKRDMDYVCAHVSDVNFARTILPEVIMKCPNVNSVKVSIELKAIDE